MSPALVWKLAAVAVLALLVFFIQSHGLAYRNDFGGDADEPAHYVTGLLFHDYCAAGFPGNPIRFAENYYLHYPKVAIGHWPPGFYLVQAAWTLPFGTSHVSMMLLVGALAFILAYQVWRTAGALYGPAAGLIAAATLLLLPLMQYVSTRVLAETLEATLCFAAAACFVRCLRRQRWQDFAGFVVLAGCAIMTKGAALLLAPVPLASILLLRRFHLLARRWLWATGAAVALLCIPAYTLLPNTGFANLRVAEGIRFDTRAIVTLPIELWREAGPAVAILIGAGIAAWLWSLFRGKPSEDLTVAAAMVIGFLLLRLCVVAAKDHRHFTLIAAPLMLFFASGARAVAACLRMPAAAAWLMSAATAALLLTSAGAQPKPYWGADRLAADLLTNPRSGGVFLIASDSTGEGVFIAETARQERRPSHYVLRATQAFAVSSWSGWEYRLKRSEPREMAEFLDSVPVSTVVFLSRPESELQPHVRLLQRFLRSRRDVWQESDVKQVRAGAAQAVVYWRVNPVDTSHPHVETDLSRKLGRSLSNY